MFLKPKEKLHIRERNDETYLEIKLPIKHTDAEKFREKTLDKYDISNAGPLYNHCINNSFSRFRKSIADKLNNQFSWFPDPNINENINEKLIDIETRRIILHTEEGYMNAKCKEDKKGTPRINIKSQGKPDFVETFYQFLRKTQK
ncbi:MAG: hypothetical protein WDZ62_00205 [Candidatus Pacearchaeota archaeon]